MPSVEDGDDGSRQDDDVRQGRWKRSETTVLVEGDDDASRRRWSRLKTMMTSVDGDTVG